MALLPSSSSGAFFAHKLDLAEGSRLRNLSGASDIKFVLESRGTRDDVSKLSATALRRNILLLAPAAKSFLKEAIADISAWELLKAKGLLTLQEQLRTSSHEAQGVPAAKTVAPLPPLPPTSPGDSGKGPVTVPPLAIGFSRGSSSSFALDLSSIAGSACRCAAIPCPVCGRSAERGGDRDAGESRAAGPARQPDAPRAVGESQLATAGAEAGAAAGSAGGVMPLLGGGQATARDACPAAGAEGRRVEVVAAQPTDTAVRQQPQHRVVPTKRTSAIASEGSRKSRDRGVGAAATTAATNDVRPQERISGVAYSAGRATPLTNAERSRKKRHKKKRQEQAARAAAQEEAEEEEHIVDICG